MNTQSLIQEFFTNHRFAMIGVSRNPKHFSRSLYDEFLKRGYDVIPVNPLSPMMNGKRCYGRVGEIEPHVTAALLITPSAGSDFIIRDCADAGVTLVWHYGISGEKDVSAEAIRTSHDLGIRIIPGYCPFMFLPETAWFHGFHGSVWKLLGKYPK